VAVERSISEGELKLQFNIYGIEDIELDTRDELSYGINFYVLLDTP